MPFPSNYLPTPISCPEQLAQIVSTQLGLDNWTSENNIFVASDSQRKFMYYPRLELSILITPSREKRGFTPCVSSVEKFISDCLQEQAVASNPASM